MQTFNLEEQQRQPQRENVIILLKKFNMAIQNGRVNEYKICNLRAVDNCN